MELYTQLNAMVEQNFVENEVNMKQLMLLTQLYFITEERKIFHLNKIINIKLKNKIASVCFVKDNHIYLVSTSVDFKKQGFAYDLLKNVLNILKTANLNVRVTNIAAIQLYLKLGFKQTLTKPHYYDHTSTPDDAYEMTYTNDESSIESFLGF